MIDIEVPIGQEFIIGDTRVRCQEGDDCKKCVVHHETAGLSKQVLHTDFWGLTSSVITSMQCGGKDYMNYPNGRTQSLACDKESRRDGKDVIFVEVERLQHIDN